MGFKKVKDYESERRGVKLVLPDDGDFADVIFLYHDYDEVLIADAHYIKSSEYNGYVHCCGTGCPACEKGIAVQSKLFIPVLVLGGSDDIALDQVKFWERSKYFADTLRKKVFENYPDPSGFVFRVTRHGQARSLDTTYDIRPFAKADFDVDSFLKSYNITFPDYYDNIIKEFSSSKLYDMIHSSSNSDSSDSFANNNTYSYTVKPRKAMVDPSTLSMDDLPSDDRDNDDDEDPFNVENKVTDSTDSTDDDEPNF